MVLIGIIGDRNPGFAAQDSIATALQHAAGALGTRVDVEWFSTPSLELEVAKQLDHVDGVWCAPGSPYLSMDGALAGIRYAREASVPFLGTCAGFQHGVIEFSRNVVGIETAHHSEYDAQPADAPLLIDELLCSLVGQTMSVQMTDELTREIYSHDEAVERYYCRFGLNESYVPVLRESGLVVAGIDQMDGSTRIMRLHDHPFFYLTLFVPQTSSTREVPHPLIARYLEVAANSSNGG